MNQGLRYFVLRSESKRLYRRFMRLSRRIEDKQQAKDLRLWIRDDFKINKNLTNEVGEVSCYQIIQSIIHD